MKYCECGVIVGDGNVIIDIGPLENQRKGDRLKLQSCILNAYGFHRLKYVATVNDTLLQIIRCGIQSQSQIASEADSDEYKNDEDEDEDEDRRRLTLCEGEYLEEYHANKDRKTTPVKPEHNSKSKHNNDPNVVEVSAIDKYNQRYGIRVPPRTGYDIQPRPRVARYDVPPRMNTEQTTRGRGRGRGGAIQRDQSDTYSVSTRDEGDGYTKPNIGNDVGNEGNRTTRSERRNERMPIEKEKSEQNNDPRESEIRAKYAWDRARPDPPRPRGWPYGNAAPTTQGRGHARRRGRHVSYQRTPYDDKHNSEQFKGNNKQYVSPNHRYDYRTNRKGYYRTKRNRYRPINNGAKDAVVNDNNQISNAEPVPIENTKPCYDSKTFQDYWTDNDLEKRFNKLK